jgi:endonuclease/exonuclease/phosphatase (EEP) superfamily protein YafD
VWKQHLTALRGEFEAAFAQGPVIMAGDFNATWGHAPFRELLSAGLRDSHVDLGQGLSTTWPRGIPLLPSLFRIDHVLLSDGVEAVAVRNGEGPSSDHRPVIADLALRSLDDC